MLAYPAIFTPEPEGGFTVTFRDVPEAITCGDTEDEAATMAEDALETALSIYVSRRDPIPVASAQVPGERLVPLSALGAAKTGLYTAMRDGGIGKAELARRLGCHMMQVDRLLDLCHASKLEQVERALAAVGMRLVVDVVRAA
ncbi:MAG: type II toxin-antitoxin system HicB family antitoxin [Alphaproteobacteria bacterium]